MKTPIKKCKPDSCNGWQTHWDNLISESMKAWKALKFPGSLLEENEGEKIVSRLKKLFPTALTSACSFLISDTLTLGHSSWKNCSKGETNCYGSTGQCAYVLSLGWHRNQLSLHSISGAVLISSHRWDCYSFTHQLLTTWGPHPSTFLAIAQV